MTRQEFLNSFIKDPWSCIRVKDLVRCVETYPEDIVPFKIVDMWSWRGVYSDACLKVSFENSTKEELLNELDDLTNMVFEGWKGGDYEYDKLTLVHFEDIPSMSTTQEKNSVGLKLFSQENLFIEHVIIYFENDRHLEGNDEVLDFTGHIIEKGNVVVFEYFDELVAGKVVNIIEGRLTIQHDIFTIPNISPKKVILNNYVRFK